MLGHNFGTEIILFSSLRLGIDKHIFSYFFFILLLNSLV